MLPARILAAAVVLSLPSVALAAAKDPVRYLELSNRAHDSVTTLAVAAPGSEAFRELDLPRRLHGGGSATTLAVPGRECRYDLRFTFSNGQSMLYQDVDICKGRVSVRPLPRQAQSGLYGGHGRIAMTAGLVQDPAAGNRA